MRLDRFITLNLVQPFRDALAWIDRPANRSSAVRPPPSALRLPILMYHSISNDAEAGVHPYYSVCTSPKRFEEQMQWLKDNGYQGVTLSDGLAWLGEAQSQAVTNSGSSSPRAEVDCKSQIANRKSEPPALPPRSSVLGPPSSVLRPPPSALAPQRSALRPVALTFDDGFHDFYMEAFPILQRYGFSATMYLPTGFIAEPRRVFSPSTVETQFSAKRACLNWSEVRELHQAGVEVGSHTVTHVRLVDLSFDLIERELRESRIDIEDHLGVATKTFAYPYAFPQADREFVAHFRELLNAAGYESSVTTRIGLVRRQDDRLRLRRLPVNDHDDAGLFQAKLAGGYNWLSGPQELFKAFRRRSRPQPVTA